MRGREKKVFSFGRLGSALDDGSGIWLPYRHGPGAWAGHNYGALNSIDNPPACAHAELARQRCCRQPTCTHTYLHTQTPTHHAGAMLVVAPSWGSRAPYPGFATAVTRLSPGHLSHYDTMTRMIIAIIPVVNLTTPTFSE
jgi:hypothetical protein